MKKSILTMIAITSLVLVSCGGGGEKSPVSEKGNWTEAEIHRAEVEIEKARPDVEAMLGENTDAYIECYLEKIKNNYDSFSAADIDEPGCTALAQECMGEIGA